MMGMGKQYHLLSSIRKVIKQPTLRPPKIQTSRRDAAYKDVFKSFVRIETLSVLWEASNTTRRADEKE